VVIVHASIFVFGEQGTLMKVQRSERDVSAVLSYLTPVALQDFCGGRIVAR
jgi:hypothetical protein